MNYDYIAGFFDGEGSISILKRYRQRPTPLYFLSVTLTNSDKRVLEEVKSFAGGSIQFDKGKGRSTPVYRYCIIGPKARIFLLSIVDKLVIKREEAEFAIRFQELKMNNKTHKLTPQQEETYELLRMSIKALHGNKFNRSQ